MKVQLTTLVSIVAAAALLAPAAGAATRPDDRGGIQGAGVELWLDPSIASVVADEASELWVDPSIANAIADGARTELWLDPALAEAVRAEATTATRPDDRAGRREVPLFEATTAAGTSTGGSEAYDPMVRIGAVLVLALIAAGFLFMRHGRRQLEHA